MQTFIAVCDAGGFAAAARRRGLSPPVVTRQVAELETRLGVRLLQRTTRAMSLTDAGARFLERARRIVGEVEEAEASAEAEQGAPRGRLVVAAPDLLGRLHIAPLVSHYLALYPAASAELQLTNRFAGMVEEGIDVAIRVGALTDSQLIVRGLGETRQVVVASPAYLSMHGTPRVPADLAGHRLVAFQGATPRRAWPFIIDGAPATVAVEPRYFSNRGDCALAHALADGGILAALDYQVDAARREGRLVEVLRAFAPSPVPIQALFPSSRLLSRKVRAFLDLLEVAAPRWRSFETGRAAGERAIGGLD